MQNEFNCVSSRSVLPAPASCEQTSTHICTRVWGTETWGQPDLERASLKGTAWPALLKAPSPCVCAQGATVNRSTPASPHTPGKHSHTSPAYHRSQVPVFPPHSYTYLQHFYNPKMGARRSLLVQPPPSKNVHFSQILHLLCSPLHMFPVATGLYTSHPNIFKLSSTPAQAHLELFDL